MQGYAVWQPDVRPQVDVGEIAGMPLALLRAGKDGWMSRRVIRRMAGELYASGVREMAFADDFPRGLLDGIPLRPVDPLPLRRALLEPLLDAFCAAQGIVCPMAVACVTAVAPDREVYRAARVLCLRARHVDVRLSHGGEALRRTLLREYGVTGSGGQTPTLHIAFDGEVRSHVPTLYLGHGCQRQAVAYELSPALREELSPLQAGEGLVSLLFAAHRLSVEEIRVKTVGSMLDTTDKTLYNAT